jgi:hypothetical protein
LAGVNLHSAGFTPLAYREFENKGITMKKPHKKFIPDPVGWCVILLALFLFTACPQATDDPDPQPGGETVEPEDQPGEKTGSPAITKFIIAGIEGLIDEHANPKTITLALPTEIAREDLSPEITLTAGAAISPPSGEPQNFTQPVDYTLTLEGVQTVYRVIVKTRAAITGFRIGETAGIIDEDASPKTITLVLPEGTNLSSLSPVITLSDAAATLNPVSGEAQDFRENRRYTLVSEGVQIEYQVTVTTAAPNTSDARAINSFIINGIPGIIDEAAKTITLTLAFGTDLKALSPEIGISAKAQVSPPSGEAQNFANSILTPKKYKVTAENGMQAEYKVTVQTDARNSFTLVLKQELSLSPRSLGLSKAKAESASVSATKDYDHYQWYIDGKPAGTDSRTITLRAEDYFIGAHYLGVMASQNEVPSYAELVFTVTP